MNENDMKTLKGFIDERAEKTERRFDERVLETKRHFDEKVAETKRHFDEKAAETQQHFDEKAAETQRHFDEKTAETKRHFEVVAEDLRSEIRIVAEGHALLNTKTDRMREEILDEMRSGFDEIRSAIRFSYAELDKRVSTLESEVTNQ